MKNVLIIGANSRIATHVVNKLADDSEMNLTLLLRSPEKLDQTLTGRVEIIAGDATNSEQVGNALKDKDIVYASLGGDVINAAETIVKEMDKQKVKRLIWISSLGIYDEVPGAFGKLNNTALPEYLKVYRTAADVIEQSDLQYTIIRPAWLTDDNDIDYETTHRNDSFKGTEVSRKSVAAYVIELIMNPEKDIKDSIGISKRNTDGNRPRKAVMLANGFNPNM